MTVYDGIIIGAGHNGLILQAYLGKAGLKTVTIERDGYAMLVIKAVDASGNETIRRMRVFVESL